VLDIAEIPLATVENLERIGYVTILQLPLRLQPSRNRHLPKRKATTT